MWSYSTITGLTAVSFFVTGLFVLLQNPRSVLFRRCFLFSTTVALWALGYYLTLTELLDYPQTLITSRLSHAVGAVIPITYLHFVWALLKKSGGRRLFVSGYISATFMFLMSLTPLVVKCLLPKMAIRYYPEWGILYPLYVGLFLLYSGYAHLKIAQELRHLTGHERARLLHFFVVVGLGFSGGISLFPLIFNIPFPPYFSSLIILYAPMMVYTIGRYQFLDIHVVIRRSLVYSILVTLLTVGYFGIIYLIEQIFQARLGYRSPVVSISAFALMALAFQPLKIAIQRLVDWLIFRVPQEQLVKRMERLEQEALQAEKLKAISTLAAGMAHEIKNPLTTLKTFAEYIPEKHQDPEFARKLHEVFTRETQRIQNIVQEVLTFAKPKTPQMKPVDLGALVSSTVDFLSSELLKQRVKWEVDCRHNGATVNADSDQLRQVLINLIQNAADAMPKGGKLTIAAQANNGHLELTISDTGQGIPKDLLSKIFDPFITTKEHGTGLGLAMVHSIIRAHHGTIHAASSAGRGTTFTLRLPL